MNRYVLTLLGTLLTANAFATTQNSDPFENFNRHMYAFNEGIDNAIVKPIAKVYEALIPSFARKGVTHFFNNLDMIPTIVNDGLQGNSENFGKDTWRFLINSTLGIGGLFDIAKNFGLPPHHEDFGITLGKWGYKNSSYLVLPFLGPSTVRDTFAIPVNYETNVYPYTDDSVNYSMNALNLSNTRANLLNYDEVLKQAFDPYIAVKNGYLQRRQAKIKEN